LQLGTADVSATLCAAASGVSHIEVRAPPGWLYFPSHLALLCYAYDLSIPLHFC
jgi:hypothetical protein